MKIWVFVGIIFLICVCLLAGIPANKAHYVYAHRIKMDMLDSVPSPRLVFLAGSSIAFGLDSRMIQDSLGIRVVNTGVHAGIGLKFMLDEVLPRLREGDILVLMPEYEHFYSKFEGSSSGALTSAVMYSKCRTLKTFSVKQLYNFLEGIPIHIRDNIFRGSGGYSALNFNEYGDETRHWGFEGKKVRATRIDGDIDFRAVEYCIEARDELKERGIRMVFLPPIDIESHLQMNKGKVDAIYREMAVRGMAYEKEPESMTVPDSLAYDSHDHVTRAGVIIESHRLIDYLRLRLVLPPVE